MRWTGANENSTSKKQRLNNLLVRLRNGPGCINDNEKLKENYSLWLETWVIPEIQIIFPKIKIKKREPQSAKDNNQHSE